MLMPVNRVDTAYEYAVIFVYWMLLRLSQQIYMIMTLNINIDHLHYISIILTSSDA